ncbi:hypothetical protein Amal_03835 [Acetobacter malorum]|uniref:Uncharacterized protein n=1 Tax=Acetobacter malorum TaxID=178901 RepID=A0A177G3S0_9PROT|nr:hypothetical protein [Acetobacter malorum]OAG75003.1 hypothetical protein Amal_03835 [Acetobacter malorum]
MSELNVYRVSSNLQYGGISPNVKIWDENGRAVLPDYIKLENWELYPVRLKKFTTDVNFIPYYAGDNFVVDETAKALLQPLIQDCGEFRPVKVGERLYWWFKCTLEYDCTVKGQIEGDILLPEANMWYDINRWVFDPVKLRQVPTIFYPHEYPTALLCTDVLKNVVEASGLVGLTFQHLWNETTGGVWVESPPVLGPIAAKLGKELEDKWKKNKKKYGLLYDKLKNREGITLL